MKLLRVGSLVTAMGRTELCDAGEHGVCYSVTENTDGSGYIYGIVFAFGKYGGFTDEATKALLHFTGEVCPGLESYQFKDVMQLCKDWFDGRFLPAFNR